MQPLQWTDIGLLSCCVAAIFFRYVSSKQTTESRERLFLRAIDSFEDDASTVLAKGEATDAGSQALAVELTDSAKKYLFALERCNNNNSNSNASKNNNVPNTGEPEEWEYMTSQDFLQRLSSFYASYAVAASTTTKEVSEPALLPRESESAKVARHRGVFTEPFALLLRLPTEDILSLSTNLLSVISNCLTFFLRPSQVLYTFLFSNMDFCIYLMEYLLERQQLFELYVVIAARRGGAGVLAGSATTPAPATAGSATTTGLHSRTESSSGLEEGRRSTSEGCIPFGASHLRDADGGENVCPHQSGGAVVEVANSPETMDIKVHKSKPNPNVPLAEAATSAAAEDHHHHGRRASKPTSNVLARAHLFLYRLRHYATVLWHGTDDAVEDGGDDGTWAQGAAAAEEDEDASYQAPSNFSFFAKHDSHFFAELLREHTRFLRRRPASGRAGSSEATDSGTAHSAWYFVLLFLQGPLLLVVLNVLLMAVLVVLHSYHRFFAVGAAAGYVAALFVLFLFGIEMSKLLEATTGAAPAGLRPWRLRRWWNGVEVAGALRAFASYSGRSLVTLVTLLRKSRDGVRGVLRHAKSEKGRQHLARVSPSFLAHLFSAGCSFFYILMLFDEGEALYSTHVEFTRWYVATTATALLELTCCVNSVVSTFE